MCTFNHTINSLTTSFQYEPTSQKMTSFRRTTFVSSQSYYLPSWQNTSVTFESLFNNVLFIYMNMFIVTVSTVDVDAVLGRTASLPCDVTPDTNEDRVYMVLWFRKSGGKPIYRYILILYLKLSVFVYSYVTLI